MDTCEHCSELRELWHNERTGLAVCEACDIELNRPALFEVVAETTVTVEAPREDVQLLDRVCAGLSVSLTWRPAQDDCLLTLGLGGASACVSVAHEAALDAFEHPVLYLDPAVVSELGVR